MDIVIGKMLDPKLSNHDAAKDSVEDWTNDFSLSVVLSGVNKAFLKLLQYICIMSDCIW